MARPRTESLSDRSSSGVERMTGRERFAAVLAQFRGGAGSIDQVVEQLNREFPMLKWRREEIYQLLRTGLAERYITVDHDRDTEEELQRKKEFGLRAIAIVPSVYFADIADRAARHLLGIIDDYVRNGKTDCISIGFASGFSMSHVARALARLLQDTGIQLPRELRLHALSVGFNPRFLREDPNFFLSAFDRDAIKHKTSDHTDIVFVGLYAPSIVPKDQLTSVCQMDGIKEGIEAAREIDIIVTSASDFDDPNSTLREFYFPKKDDLRDKKTKEAMKQEAEALQEAGIVGHLLYLPLGEAGPIDQAQFILPTVVSLRQLHEMAIQPDKRVVLVTGLRTTTFQPKKITGVILRQQNKLITDLVTNLKNVEGL